MADTLLALRDHGPGIVAMLAAAERSLICTDFDGTLVPICEDPDHCVLDGHMRTVIAALHRPPLVHVAIVSGRRLDDVRSRVGIEGIIYSGNHGLEIAGDGLAFREPKAVACRRLIRETAEQLQPHIAAIEGASLEHKDLTLTVHCRRVRAADVPKVHAAVTRVSAGAVRSGHLRLHGGKQVIEVRPDVGWGKGQAVNWIGCHLECRREHRVFIGDDETDEEAFAACSDGITIRIGEWGVPTAARYLADAADLSAFFTMLRDAVDDRHATHPAAGSMG